MLLHAVDNGDEQLNIHEGEYTFPEGTQAEVSDKVIN